MAPHGVEEVGARRRATGVVQDDLAFRVGAIPVLGAAQHADERVPVKRICGPLASRDVDRDGSPHQKGFRGI